MNILKLVYNQVHQGTYWRALYLAKILAQRGHHVTLVATSRAEHWRVSAYLDNGLTVVETPDLFSGPLRSGWDPWNTLARYRWLASKKFDIVHAYESRPTVIFPALYAQSHGARLVMDWCDWLGQGGLVEERNSPVVRAILRPVETFFEERFRTRAAATTVICSLLQKKAVALGVQKDSILLLPNGTDPTKWAYQEVRDSRDSLCIPPDALMIGYVGTMFPSDAEFMVRAFDEVASRVFEARLLVIGNNTIDLATRSRYPERIQSTGYLVSQEEIFRRLAACNLVWLPLQDSNANRGRLPYKLMDYMVAGRPVVATAVGDVVNILQEEDFGWLSPADPAIFAEMTIKLLRDQKLQDRMGRAARAAAEGKFRWENLADGLEQLYWKVLSP